MTLRSCSFFLIVNILLINKPREYKYFLLVTLLGQA